MKCMIVFALILVVCHAKLVNRSFVTEEIREECRNEHGLSDKEAKTLKSGETLSEAKKCHLKCMVQKSGYIDADGNILVEKMKTDQIADGPQDRLKKVWKCLDDLKTVKTCDEITGVISCFGVH